MGHMSGSDGLVVTVIGDLFMRQKVAESLAAAGWGSMNVAGAARLDEALAERRPDCLVVQLDAGGFDGPELVGALKRDPDRGAIPIVAFAGHTRVEALRAARAAGCDRVVTRGELQLRLGALVDELAGAPAAEG